MELTREVRDCVGQELGWRNVADAEMRGDDAVVEHVNRLTNWELLELIERVFQSELTQHRLSNFIERISTPQGD